MNELSRDDNDRCYELEQNILKVGDGSVGIEASNIQSPEAQAFRTQALTALHAARTLLEQMYEAELQYVQHHAYTTQHTEPFKEDIHS